MENRSRRAAEICCGAPRGQRGAPNLKCTATITSSSARIKNEDHVLSKYDVSPLEECGAGGGNRTIRAYSFYVTCCKHTNARTAQPAVCPPPMYKIMYNNSKAECVVGLLTPGCAPPLPVYRTASGSFPTATFLSRSTRRGWVPRHALSGFKITHLLRTTTDPHDLTRLDEFQMIQTSRHKGD